MPDTIVNPSAYTQAKLEERAAQYAGFIPQNVDVATRAAYVNMVTAYTHKHPAHVVDQMYRMAEGVVAGAVFFGKNYRVQTVDIVYLMMMCKPITHFNPNDGQLHLMMLAVCSVLSKR